MGQMKKWFALGFLLSTCVWTACGLVGIRYYTMDGVDYSGGKLLGPKPKEDRVFSDCQPRQDDQNPCVVMFREDFMNLKTDYYDMNNRLEECERRCRN